MLRVETLFVFSRSTDQTGDKSIRENLDGGAFAAEYFSWMGSAMKRHGFVLALFVWVGSVCFAGQGAGGTAAPGAPGGSGAPAAPGSTTTQPAKIDDSNMPWEYIGDIDEKLPISMTLRFASKVPSATGCYCYAKYQKDIQIDAKIDSRSIVIREFDNQGTQTGKFVGEFAKADPRKHFATKEDLQREVIVGNWSKPDGSGKRPFYLVASHAQFWREGESRYISAGFDNEAQVDQFMARFRLAVMAHDVDAAAKMIRFPIYASIDGKRETITTAQEFAKKYDKIMKQEYVDRVRGSLPCHMFARDQGVMLGSGEVWVAPVEKDGKHVPMVIAVGN